MNARLIEPQVCVEINSTANTGTKWSKVASSSTLHAKIEKFEYRLVVAHHTRPHLGRLFSLHCGRFARGGSEWRYVSQNLCGLRDAGFVSNGAPAGGQRRLEQDCVVGLVMVRLPSEYVSVC